MHKVEHAQRRAGLVFFAGNRHHELRHLVGIGQSQMQIQAVTDLVALRKTCVARFGHDRYP